MYGSGYESKAADRSVRSTQSNPPDAPPIHALLWFSGQRFEERLERGLGKAWSGDIGAIDPFPQGLSPVVGARNGAAEAAPLQNKVKASVFRPGAAPFGC
jgi:hypothetical protein